MILLALLLAGTRHSPPAELLADPAYQLCKTMVGRWEGTVAGGKIKVQFTFHVEPGTGMFVGEGLVGAGTANPMPIRSTLGWDPEAKQLYYLDQHGVSTVYFGHVTKEGDALLWDFRGLVGDPGHYRSRETVSPTEYSSDMSEEKNGEWVNSGVHIRLHRVK